MKSIINSCRFAFIFFIFSHLDASALYVFSPLPFNADIGNPSIKGNYRFDAKLQEAKLEGGGYNIWNDRDEFHFAWDTLSGDFMLTASLRFADEQGDPHKKTGWMIRAGNAENSAQISAALHGDGLAALQWRPAKGMAMAAPQNEIRSMKSHPGIIQLERQGQTFIMRSARFGEPLQETGRIELADFPDHVLGGLFICSHNAQEKTEAKAWNIRIEKTVPDSYNGYRDPPLQSRLETINVFTGKRTLIHTAAGRFEAPNWRMDKDELLFNQDGRIYSIPSTGGKPYVINTGNVNQNNNDHVISFDGKELAISSHRALEGGGGSAIYIVPVTGGHPELITDSVPSYLHGWHPNGQELSYTAYRPSQSAAYNIYTIHRKTRIEKQLTFLDKGLADGPEYSPDGKYIYYNSTETGTMQIWRMKTDGSEKEQLTFDEYNDWFPHVSPDNKYMVFLSYDTRVAPADHPAYKRVMLRFMPLDGGAPRVIAYLFGGQGTLNVPSWSADSRRIAFVSYTR